jgi:glyoxylase I family protein
MSEREAMPVTKLSHVDLVVSSLERSLRFYRGLLEPIGWSGLSEITGERGETVWYLSAPGPGTAAIGLRETRSDAHPLPYDRYAVAPPPQLLGRSLKNKLRV